MLFPGGKSVWFEHFEPVLDFRRFNVRKAVGIRKTRTINQFHKK
jgi:hypothetical protein